MTQDCHYRNNTKQQLFRVLFLNNINANILILPLVAKILCDRSSTLEAQFFMIKSQPSVRQQLAYETCNKVLLSKQKRQTFISRVCLANKYFLLNTEIRLVLK